MNLPEHSWLYKNLENRVCVELNEATFFNEIDGFLFDTWQLENHLLGIDLETLKFSRVIDGVEEAYHPKKDKDVLTGSPIYYPDDNCFIIYFCKD